MTSLTKTWRKSVLPNHQKTKKLSRKNHISNESFWFSKGWKWFDEIKHFTLFLWRSSESILVDIFTRNLTSYFWFALISFSSFCVDLFLYYLFWTKPQISKIPQSQISTDQLRELRERQLLNEFREKDCVTEALI